MENNNLNELPRNAIKRPTIFDNFEDDEDDNTGLFKKGIERRHMNKPSLFDTVMSQNNTTNTANTNLNIPIPSNITNNNTLLNTSQRDTLQSYARESTNTTYSQFNQNIIKTNNTQGSSTNLNNLIENKNRNLESKIFILSL